MNIDILWLRITSWLIVAVIIYILFRFSTKWDE